MARFRELAAASSCPERLDAEAGEEASLEEEGGKAGNTEVDERLFDVDVRTRRHYETPTMYEHANIPLISLRNSFRTFLIPLSARENTTTRTFSNKATEVIRQLKLYSCLFTAIGDNKVYNNKIRKQSSFQQQANRWL